MFTCEHSTELIYFPNTVVPVVTKLFILSPKFLVCSLFTSHTCTVTAYTHHFDFGTGREYIMSCSGSHEARRRRYSYTQQSGRKTGATSEQKQKPRRVQPRCRERDLGAMLSEIGHKTCGKPEGLSYIATERVAEDTCETWDCTRRSVAGHVASRG